MQVHKSITISEFVNNKLKFEPNASFLIEKLLRDYYKITEPELLEEVNKVNKIKAQRKWEEDKIKRIQEACKCENMELAKEIAKEQYENI